jgi:hypothetical protein
LTIFVLKNLHRLFDKYTVAHTEHDTLVKSTTKIFSNFVAFSENPKFKWSLNFCAYSAIPISFSLSCFALDQLNWKWKLCWQCPAMFYHYTKIKQRFKVWQPFALLWSRFLEP